MTAPLRSGAAGLGLQTLVGMAQSRTHGNMDQYLGAESPTHGRTILTLPVGLPGNREQAYLTWSEDTPNNQTLPVSLCLVLMELDHGTLLLSSGWEHSHYSGLSLRLSQSTVPIPNHSVRHSLDLFSWEHSTR